MNPVHFSSATDNWATPQDFFDKVAQRLGPFHLDVCADHQNAKAIVYFTKEDDGLKQQWFGRCWMNPPYGKEIGRWMRKAWEAAQGPLRKPWFAWCPRAPTPRGGTTTPRRAASSSSEAG